MDGPAPTGMSRSLRALVEEVSVIGIADEAPRDAFRRNPHDRRARARRRRRCGVSIACTVSPAMDAPRGAVSLGFRPVCHDVTSHGFFGAGIEPANAETSIQCQTVWRSKASTNRNRTGGGVSRRCSIAARPSGIRHFETPSCASGMRHGRAARTGWNDNPRRWKRSSDASHCRRSRIGNSFDRRVCRRSGLVPLRVPPASKHHNARECVRQRAPGLGVGITGCFGTKRKMEGIRAGMPAWARTRVVLSADRSADRSAFRPLETKRPRRASEGVRVPRRSGRPISRERDQSAVKPLSSRAAPYPARHRPCSRRSRDFGLLCWWMAGFISAGRR